MRCGFRRHDSGDAFEDSGALGRAIEGMVGDSVAVSGDIGSSEG